MLASPPGPSVVDLWVRRRLAEDYGAVLAEDLPEAWLKLLQAPPR